MSIPVQDKSNYLKGLLIIAKRDNILSESEEEILKNLAKKLGFSTDFYEYTIQNLLTNEYLSEEPVEFSENNIAKSFIQDGLRLANSDNHLHEEEVNWLRQTALNNNLKPEWFDEKLNELKNNHQDILKTEFALLSLI
ncbi:TerB family tellurite resistance protein [bacterium BMS3Abin03]|jgi:uncharacterized tellurite resistance protein B-like protein|nr:TerB family tellurite resistance protein [bacterium BMS3Abin03]MCG6959853.1 TerB family tellurite resistance protein [bacterium BMS3Abin03]